MQHMDILAKKFEFTPTPRQQEIITAVTDMDDNTPICIQARAGATKTSTLEMCAAVLDAQGFSGSVMAFNRLIIEEAQRKFPSSVIVKTVHAHAFAALSNQQKAKLKVYPDRKTVATKFLKLGFIKITYPSKHGSIPVHGSMHSFEQLRLAEATVEKFCQSADTSISKKHVPFTKFFGTLSLDTNIVIKEQYVDIILRAARKIWEDVTIGGSENVQFRHSHYLKMWELDNPILGVDYIFVDEAQDLSGVMLSVIKKNLPYAKKVVLVGDNDQAIYAFTGAVNALGIFTEDYDAQVHYLTQSFRFDSKIADTANTFLELLDAEFLVEGASTNESVVGTLDYKNAEVDAVVTRTNAGGLAVYMQTFNDMRVCLMVDSNAIIKGVEGLEALQAGDKVKHPDLMEYKDYSHFLKELEKDNVEYQIKLIHKAMDDYGPDRIKSALNSMPKEEEADMIIVTAHKCKGREWDRVAIHSDFTLAPSALARMSTLPVEYLRLCYVAVTRAKTHLDWSALRDIRDKMNLITESN